MRQEKRRGEREPTFEETLRELIQLAHGAVSDSKVEQGSAGEVRDDIEAGTAGPQSQLRRRLENLEPETALKVRTLMIAGREGRDVAAIRLETPLGESQTALTTADGDASDNGALLADHLRRGHALACAAAINLESPLAAWGANHAATLDERAWLSFGRQLASSEPEDWQFLGCVEPGGKEIIRLYVKLRDHAWWSFQSLLDRPSGACVTKETRALASRRTKGVMASSLRTLAAQFATAPVPAGKGSASVGAKRAPAPQGRALRRAARAIRARVGESISPHNET
jgi:hypothetical protein